MIISQIDSLFTGRPKDFSSDGGKSSMAREPQIKPVMARQNGFDGDEVADKVSHGGADKAIHLYPAEHYPFWLAKLDGHPLLQKAGAFGENIGACGLTEGRVKIGDQFRMGAATLEISHGRQPCWKIDHRFSTKGVSREVIRTGKCGIYLRVKEEGEIAAGDKIEQIYSASHAWTVEAVFNMLIGGGHRGDGAADKLAQLAELPALAVDWQKRAAAFLKKNND